MRFLLRALHWFALVFIPLALISMRTKMPHFEKQSQAVGYNLSHVFVLMVWVFLLVKLIQGYRKTA